jgi:hypothetical protein
MLTLVAIMLMMPYSMRGATTTIDFGPAGIAATNWSANPPQSNYETHLYMSNEDYNTIGNGAKVGDRIDYKYKSSAYTTLNISRLAFIHNTNGVGGADIDGDGFYLRYEKIGNNRITGLYTSRRGQKLAVRNLKPGDKVTIYYGGSNESGYDANLHNDTYNYWFTQISSGQTASATVDINFVGDLILSANRGTIIQSITIESEVAEYDITTNGNETTFEFTKNGTLEENDFSLPYLSFSMGSINDYLVVQGNNKEVHMFKPNDNGSETLETGGHNAQPSAGSFYEFKPTGGGVVTMYGSLNGTVHLFVYDPTPGTDTWVELQGNYPIFYKLNFPDPNNRNPGQNSPYYDENYSFTNNNDGTVTFSFSVEKDKYYYVCIDNLNNTEKDNGYAFHMHKMKFTNTFHLAELAKVIDLTGVNDGDWIGLTAITGYGSADIHTKRCSGNINPLPKESYMIQNGYLYMKKPTFVEGTDNAGTVLIDVKTKGGNAVFVATFPYHADFNPAGYTDTNRTYGHTWNFIDPRNSDTNFGNCWINDGWDYFTKGTTSGILSIGQDKNSNSQFHQEVLNREWTYSQRQTGSSGGFHDPYYVNVWDMVGDNADMIWETEGLWFETGTNLSCIYNESNPLVWDNDKEKDLQVGNPLNFAVPRMLKDDGVSLADPIGVDGKGNPLYADPDRYVGLLPVTDGKKSSFTIPGLKKGDRVLIFMKSGEGSGTNGIFLNVVGAKDAVGTQIETDDTDPETWYRAGGTNWQHNRYEGCYHFIKDDVVDPTTGYGSMTFDMQSGSMCKLMYIRIYTGKRIDTNDIVSTKYNIPDGVDDNGNPKYKSETGYLLFVNDKDATTGDYSQFSLRFRGKGQKSTNRVLTYSGNLNDNSFTGNKWKVSGDYNQYIDFTSTVGEIGMFRLRFTDVEYSDTKYVADFTDRNFTVGYRDKVDSYPYTWDLTDIMNTSYSTAAKVAKDASEYKEVDLETYPNENTGWDISLFDTDGYMKVNSGVDPAAENQIFSSDKKGFGNQLWAYGGAIPEARGLWFYQDDNKNSADDKNEGNDPKYNDCIQITTDGLCFVNKNLSDGSHDPWWNFKMVVPDVPADGAVYLRMKRDSRVKDTDMKYSDKAGKEVLFLNTRFAWGTGSKTSLTEPIDGTYTSIYRTQENGTAYSFFEVPNTTTDEYILAVKNKTGEMNHLQLTLNGWIVEKVAVSKDDKTLNKKGYASESRNRVIDHSLTSFFTGKPIKAYTAESYDAAASTIGLVEITKPMPAATTTAGQNVGSVLYNSDCADADDEDCGKVLDNKFNLFVPDMHDYKGDPNYPLGNPNITNSDMSSHAGELQSTTNNLMLSYNTGATSNATIPQKINDSSVYVLSYQYFEHDKDNLTENDINEAQVEAFYRVAKNGAGIKPNSAYLILPVTSSPAKVSFLFGDELFGEVNNGIATGITDALELDNGKLEWYSLDGRKLNGAPTAKGLYIVNGRKVLVK